MSLRVFFLLLCCGAVAPAGRAEPAVRTLTRADLSDRIRGAWAGQMIGVSYGAPTEFKFLGKTNDGPITPAGVENSLQQDDLYVEMTFAWVMDTVGLDATTEQYGEAFRDSKYELWHANAGARRNLNRGIAAPLSGDPRYNLHCDDIDFQIESDFIGIMCPGLPQAANLYADRVGRVMNRGDGLYGGMFISGMYAAAYFETDPRRVVAAGLASIPPASAYAAVIRDVLAWSGENPGDWRRTWQQLEEKWDRNDLCPDGFDRPFNIDAKLNGAYVALGLIYGAGDWARTLEITTRCGQDSDCNPSSAAGILGTMIGFRNVPEPYRMEATRFSRMKFAYTEYTLDEIVASTERRAIQVIARAGGTVTGEAVFIPDQPPAPPPLEKTGCGIPAQRIDAADPAWEWSVGWHEEAGYDWGKRTDRVSREAATVATLKFNGTGVALVGELGADGGQAEVYVDGILRAPLADAYIVPNTHDNDLWRVQGLEPGEHTLRVVTLDQADPRSSGRAVRISAALVFN